MASSNSVTSGALESQYSWTGRGHVDVMGRVYMKESSLKTGNINMNPWDYINSLKTSKKQQSTQ